MLLPSSAFATVLWQTLRDETKNALYSSALWELRKLQKNYDMIIIVSKEIINNQTVVRLEESFI